LSFAPAGLARDRRDGLDRDGRGHRAGRLELAHDRGPQPAGHVARRARAQHDLHDDRGAVAAELELAHVGERGQRPPEPERVDGDGPAPQAGQLEYVAAAALDGGEAAVGAPGRAVGEQRGHRRIARDRLGLVGVERPQHLVERRGDGQLRHTAPPGPERGEHLAREVQRVRRADRDEARLRADALARDGAQARRDPGRHVVAVVDPSR